MDCCSKCSCVLTQHNDEDQQIYYIANMGQDIIDVIERMINCQVNIDGLLCQPCFDDVMRELDHNHNQASRRDDTNICVWCRRSLSRRRTHELPDGPVRDEIARRIAPLEIPVNALVCYACWLYTNNLVQQNTDQPTARTVGTNVCVWCTRALSRRRTHSLPEGPERSLIRERIMPRDIPTNARVCYACWVNAQRSVLRERATNESEQEPSPGPSQPVQHNYCIWCRSSLHQRQTRLLNEESARDIVLARIFPREMPNNAMLCVPCWRRVQSIIYNAGQEEEIQNLPNILIELDEFRHTTNSSSRCFVPECGNTERLCVPEYIRKQVLKTQKIYITENARTCQEHSVIYNWEFLNQYDFSNSFTKTEIESMLLLSTQGDSCFQFDLTNVNTMPENVFRFWTGVAKAQFDDLLSQIPSIYNNCKTPRSALIIFLTKVHTGEPHDRLASLFQRSKATISRLLKNARSALLSDFVPIHLGINHIPRTQLIEKNLIIPEGLFGDRDERRPIVICDGTYIYVQKSSNYLYQKETYSLHKHRNLIKPFLIVATDGYILDAFGPYPAIKSDAEIMKELFQHENSALRGYFQPQDIFILDRGFRDAIPLLEQIGYKIHKPETLDQDEVQLSTIKANKSRLVTLCRWVVEVVNGRFKNEYKLFRADYFNLASTHLMDDFRICAALINAYHVPLRDRPDAEMILNRALQRVNIPNYLGNYVIANNINRRRAHFHRIDSTHEELNVFPEMTMSDLILFALGIYQIRQAKSYYGEHIRPNGSFQVEICNNLEATNVPELSSSETVLLRGRIKSRHQTNKIYYTYVLIKQLQDELDWEQKIVQYYCSCICGMRTVGCCAHVMTIVWYLGWARHQDNITAPACFLDRILIREDLDID